MYPTSASSEFGCLFVYPFPIIFSLNICLFILCFYVPTSVVLTCLSFLGLQGSNLNSVMNEIDLRCKDLETFKIFTPPNYPAHSLLYVFTWIIWFIISSCMPVLFFVMYRNVFILSYRLFHSLFFCRHDCGFYVMLYAESWNGKTMKHFTKVFDNSIVFFLY